MHMPSHRPPFWAKWWRSYWTTCAGDSFRLLRGGPNALVLGLGGHVQSSPPQLTQPARSVDTTFQSDPSQKPDQSKSPCMAPRATAIKEQGFSEAVAVRLEAPQRRSTRSVYEAKWTTFAKWCITNQVDLRSPPIKSVADFLTHLFEDR